MRWRVGTGLLLALAAIPAGGCGSSSHPRRADEASAANAAWPTAIPLGSTPALVRRFCATWRRQVPSRCPSLWPRRHGSRDEDGRNFTREPYEGYLVTFNDPAFRTDDAGHMWLGGQPAQLSLAGRIGERWPGPGEPRPDPEMRLGPDAGSFAHARPATLVGRARVGGLPAIVLRVPPFPAGGVHGGHVVVLWNQDRHGYLVSLHFGGAPEPRPGRYTPPKRFRYTEADRINASLQIADSAASTPRPSP